MGGRGRGEHFVEFEGDVETINNRNRSHFELDEATDPKQIDYRLSDSEGSYSHGIYAFEGDDRLLICVTTLGCARPTRLSVDPSSREFLMVLERVSD